MKYRNILFAVTAVLLTASCGDMLDTDSEIVEFEENNHLNSVSDTVYSVLGIINRIQVIAERNALIGDVHSDLIATTGKTSTDLKALSDFTAGIGNRYNQVSDYYAVINNCNNYLAKADTMTHTERREGVQARICGSEGIPCMGISAGCAALRQIAVRDSSRVY